MISIQNKLMKKLSKRFSVKKKKLSIFNNLDHGENFFDESQIDLDVQRKSSFIISNISNLNSNCSSIDEK